MMAEDGNYVKVMMTKNRELERRCSQGFFEIFHVTLPQYMNLVTGFDICKFEKEVTKSPDGMSMEDVIRRDYGDGGVAVIKCLIGMEG